jgi:hypothetical protein
LSFKEWLSGMNRSYRATPMNIVLTLSECTHV